MLWLGKSGKNYGTLIYFFGAETNEIYIKSHLGTEEFPEEGSLAYSAFKNDQIHISVTIEHLKETISRVDIDF